MWFGCLRCRKTGFILKKSQVKNLKPMARKKRCPNANPEEEGRNQWKFYSSQEVTKIIRM
jgi:hypothetical protein